MSINILTNYGDLDRGKIIIDNDSWFNEYITADMIDSVGMNAMTNIDNAILLDKVTGKIETSRGITSIENLSTGCKTILNYMYADKEKEYINITQCGANALEELFEVMEKVPITRSLILMHRDGLYKCKEREYIINGKKRINNLLYI